MSVLNHLLDARSGAPITEALSEGFDENLHPRDFLGRWKKKVGGLKAGESASLPDGVKVTRTSSGFDIHAPGGKTGRVEGDGAALASVASGENAATLAAQKSAQSDSPKSLGGTTKYRSASDWVERGTVGSDTRRGQDLSAQKNAQDQVAVKRRVRQLPQAGGTVELPNGTKVERLSNGNLKVNGQLVGNSLDQAARVAAANERVVAKRKARRESGDGAAAHERRLAELKPGESVTLPNGTTVYRQKRGDGFVVGQTSVNTPDSLKSAAAVADERERAAAARKRKRG